jgi:hypothetical protein
MLLLIPLMLQLLPVKLCCYWSTRQHPMLPQYLVPATLWLLPVLLCWHWRLLLIPLLLRLPVVLPVLLCCY